MFVLDPDGNWATEAADGWLMSEDEFDVRAR
jgi:hypothetical protein